MEVIKLGGSLYGTTALTDWLAVLERQAQKQTLILVPGGGPFADAVRLAQQQHGFDDKTAHRMAINAMQQFSVMLLALSKHAVKFSFPSTQPPRNGKLNIWLPTDALLLVDEIEQSWRVTADSLALWLASQIAAEQLTLVKSCDIFNTKIQSLSQNKQVDAAFANGFQTAQISCSVVHASQSADYRQLRKAIQ